MPEIVFLHPDLGIGGAERAVIDAALALKSKAHSVQFVTAHHDKNHCFQETRDGSLTVIAVGDWLPRSILGHCYALCAYIRMLYAAIFLVFFSSIKFDVVICDQISACIPVLRWSGAKILFYCHFPDMLLTARQTFLKKVYRAPIDWLEEKTTGMADCILVNSKFTGMLKCFQVLFVTWVFKQLNCRFGTNLVQSSMWLSLFTPGHCVWWSSVDWISSVSRKVLYSMLICMPI